MQKINIEEIREGMMLDVSIKDEAGNILIKSGTLIKENHIEMIKNSNIDFILVTGHPIEKQFLKQAEEKRKEISERFLNAGNNEFIISLKNICLELFS